MIGFKLPDNNSSNEEESQHQETDGDKGSPRSPWTVDDE
jgi:hypothetical protein